MEVNDILGFVPSKNYSVSKAFYSEIGFETEYVSDELTLVQNGERRFFLQDFYNEELAKNFMLQICVTNIDEAYSKCLASEHKTKLSEITDERWGKVFYLWGPSGELLHMTQLKRLT